MVVMAKLMIFYAIYLRRGIFFAKMRDFLLIFSFYAERLRSGIVTSHRDQESFVYPPPDQLPKIVINNLTDNQKDVCNNIQQSPCKDMGGKCRRVGYAPDRKSDHFAVSLPSFGNHA
jgi:hypothetical protein